MGGYDIGKWKDLINSDISMEQLALFSCLSLSKAIIEEENKGKS